MKEATRQVANVSANGTVTTLAGGTTTNTSTNNGGTLVGGVSGNASTTTSTITAVNANASPVTARSVTFSDPGLIEPPNMQATTPPNTVISIDEYNEYSRTPNQRNTSFSLSQVIQE